MCGSHVEAEMEIEREMRVALTYNGLTYDFPVLLC